MCTAGKVVYPQVLSDGTPLGSRFTLTTDQNGQAPLTVWAGTVPGHALTEASETADTSVKDTVSFPLSASARTSLARRLRPAVLQRDHAPGWRPGCTPRPPWSGCRSSPRGVRPADLVGVEPAGLVATFPAWTPSRP